MKGKNKRKQRITNEHEDDERRSTKIVRIDHSEVPAPASELEPLLEEVDRETLEHIVEGSAPWRNLQLILSLQSKHVPPQKKVELAYDYVKLRVAKEADGTSQESDMVSNSRLIVFLNNWIQSLLINSEKEIRVEKHKAPSENSDSCLDCRCWEIFKFCLEEALKLHVSLSFSRDILRVIQCMAKTMLFQLDVASSHQEVGDLNNDDFKWNKTVLDCISFVFTSHGGVSKDNLDLWILAVAAVLELVKKVSIGNLHDSKTTTFVLDLSCLVLEPFAKFLRLHPVKKNGFSDFIDQLLEPLLCLLDVLHPRVQGRIPGSLTYLRKLVDEVLSQGLFHPSNVDGFLSLQSLAKYKVTDDTKPKYSTTTIKSYHRHLFDKLQKIVARKIAALGGVGELLRVYVNCIGKQNDVSAHDGVSTKLKDDICDGMLTRSSGASIAASEKSQYSTLGSETRKSLFEFFVQITEPLINEMDTYLEADLETGTMLLDLQYTLKSTNTILNNFIQANVYIRAEDTSEGACLNFLKVIYNKMASFSARINQLLPSTFGFDGRPHKEVLDLVAKELVVATRHLVEIEYDVVENDPESLWLMMLSYGSLGISSTEFCDQSELISEVLHLGCHLFNLYSELRQVNSSVFALCKAVRRLVSSIGDGELCHSEFMPCEASLYYESWAKSLRIVLCSPEFKGSIHNAIKSIPEGQVSGCVRELTDDISESLEWMKESTSSACFHLKVEILGRGLSEVYTTILDSLTVTTGNSCLVGVSLKGLMEVIRPSMTSLVSLLPDGAYDEFLSTITGRSFNKESGCKNDLNSAHWVFLLHLLRLYMPYRSLYRQSMSLAPPDTARKMSRVVYDPFAAYSGKDWLETTEGQDEGYFSWVVQPSASLLMVTKTISDICLHGVVADCSPLIYVLVSMALQRLADLNRLIKSFDYLLKRNDNLKSTIPTDDTEIKIYHKESKKLKKKISDLRQEAEGLTNFMMDYLPLITEVQLSVSSSDTARDSVVSAMSRKSLPLAFWSIMCHNIDIWCSHATKKQTKTFLSVLFQTSFPSSSCSSTDFKNHSADKLVHPKTVTPHNISSELLSDSVLYEQKFVRRHMASRFCRYLQESAAPLLSKKGKVDLSSPPDWTEVLSALESSSFVVSGKANAGNRCSSGADSKQPMERCSQQEITESNTKKYTVALNLLNFLCWIPKGYLTSKSFSLYATCIFNLERLVIDSLLDCHDALQSHDGYELFRLFLSCRRALKHLVVAFSEGKPEVSQSSLPPILFESSLPAIWLLRSLCAVSDLQHIFTEDSVNQVKDMMFSLMDYTSHVFLVLSKAQFMPAIHSLISAGKSCEQKVCHKQNRTDYKPSSYTSEVIDVWNSVVDVAENLKQQALFLFVPIKEAIHSKSVAYCTVHESKKLLSTLSCFEGYFRGLSSAYENIDVESSKLKKKMWRRKFEPIDKINLCIDTFGDIIISLLCELSFEDGKLPQSLSSVQGSSATDCTDNPFTLNSCTYFGDDKHNKKKRFQPEKADVDSIMTTIDLTEQQYLCNPILRALLSGENHEGAFLLRELFIAASTMLKLNLQIISTSLLSSLGPTFLTTAQVLFLEFAEKIEAPSPFSFVLLDGIAKYLQELWNHFLLTNPTFPERFYAKLIDIHLIAIGKCISLQGKEATLASRAAESSTKTLNFHRELSATINYRTLDEFKGRLRMAFTVFLRASSELHISCAIHHLVSVLVVEGCLTNYQLSSDGGKVSSTVAACIDCLDLLLEFATERKCLSEEVKEQIQKFVSCLFNVILRLQSPKIFSANPMNTKSEPDPGSVILMCVEVLIRITRKPAGYQMDSCFVQQGLRLPAALFRNIFQLKISSDIESLNTCIVDRKFTIDLYDACCRLLGSFLGHHAREIRPCLALLEDSVQVLLSCLEVVDINLAVQNGNFVWELPEAVKCASFLRRIYEELRHQCLKKEVFLSRHCSQLLTNYIWIYSGFGPHKRGIKREIDEALRPGVYALVDSCSVDDFQYMHTVFGEGPCRTHLANLRHDYEINFKYQGKV